MKITFRKIVMALIVIAIIGLVIFSFKKIKTIYSQEKNNEIQPTPTAQNSPPTVVATNPPDLQNTIILPNQTVQIIFSDPVLNTDELKHKMDPEGGYTLKLSDDRKTLSIIPNPMFQLGRGYTFSILSDGTKFDGGKKLQSDILIHFNTVAYSGV